MQLRALFVIFLAVTGVEAQKSVPWYTGSWKAAFDEAHRRNVPLIIGFNQDDEEANERVVASLYTDAAFIKLADQAIQIITCMQLHTPVKSEVEGSTQSVCSRFGTVSCERHKEYEMAARDKFFHNIAVTTPHHVICLPDGTEVVRLQDVHGVVAFEDGIRKAKKLIGPGLSREHFKIAKETLKKGLAAAKAGESEVGFQCYDECAKLAKGMPFLKEAEAIITELAGQGATAWEMATELHKQGKLLDALRLLGTIQTKYQALEVAKNAKSLDQEIRKSKEGREAAQLLQKEERLRPEFVKATEWEKKREFAKAAQSFAKVALQAPGTVIGDDAAKRLAFMRGDPDIAGLILKPLGDYDAEKSLREAEVLISSGDKAAAQSKLKEILEKWPDAPASARAKKLLGPGP